MSAPDADRREIYTCHKHQPAHLFRSGAVYFITAKTLHGLPHLAAEPRRAELLDSLQFACRQREWTLIAWVVLANHYHVLLKAPEAAASSLPELLAAVHGFTSRRWNKQDAEPGRTVWYQYWDVCLSSLSSFYTRLNYIHHNPVKHGCVSDPANYSYSSYSLWSESADLREIEEGYPWDRLDLEG